MNIILNEDLKKQIRLYNILAKRSKSGGIKLPKRYYSEKLRKERPYDISKFDFYYNEYYISKLFFVCNNCINRIKYSDNKTLELVKDLLQFKCEADIIIAANILINLK